VQKDKVVKKEVRYKVFIWHFCIVQETNNP
jgi:hypothetical protein